MLFNSFDFLIFFPIVCIVYYLIPFRFRHIFLLAASYYFYMCWNPQYALLMLTSTAITYVSGILIQRTEKKDPKKLFVALSFILNLGILFFFKYFNFTVGSINKVLAFAGTAPVNAAFDVILPVGISFYTFQALSYTVDVYRGEIYAEKNFLKYALFVSFFPQLVAGPIERSKNLLKQISVKHRFDAKQVQSGLTLMLYGLFQKMVISDNIALVVDQIYNNHDNYSGVVLVYASIMFAFQIYCDFGGYSNIAIGASRVMGFSLMENFDTPYFSKTVAEFWRRWHISLSSWFRDYLYIPLGGNRKGIVRKYFNLMVVFLASGLWHGASWHYVVWGGINGAYQIIGSVLQPIRKKLCEIFKINTSSFSHQVLKVLLTFLMVDFSWIFFRANGFLDALSIIKGMITRWDISVLFDGTLPQIGLQEGQFTVLMIALAVLLVADLCKYLKINLVEKFCQQGIWFQYLGYFIIIFIILLFGCYGSGYDSSQFIYFQF